MITECNGANPVLDYFELLWVALTTNQNYFISLQTGKDGDLITYRTMTMTTNPVIPFTIAIIQDTLIIVIVVVIIIKLPRMRTTEHSATRRLPGSFILRDIPAELLYQLQLFPPLSQIPQSRVGYNLLPLTVRRGSLNIILIRDLQRISLKFDLQQLAAGALINKTCTTIRIENPTPFSFHHILFHQIHIYRLPHGTTWAFLLQTFSLG